MIAHLINSLYGLFCRPSNKSKTKQYWSKGFWVHKTECYWCFYHDITFSAAFAFCILREEFYIFRLCLLIMSLSYEWFNCRL